MTSFAFILGCVPLWRATGAGAVARRIMGTTVIGGMLAATLHRDLSHPGDVLPDRKLGGEEEARRTPQARSGHGDQRRLTLGTTRCFSDRASSLLRLGVHGRRGNDLPREGIQSNSRFLPVRGW